MTLYLTNTLKRAKEAFIPENPHRVMMYVCAPQYTTSPTLVMRGQLSYLMSSIVYLRRFDCVWRPKLHRCRRQDQRSRKGTQLPIGAITDRYIDAYHADMAALEFFHRSGTRVTEDIPEIISMIKS